MSFGKRVSIGSRAMLRITDRATLFVGDGSNIARDSTIIAKYGSIRIGARSFVGHGSTIAACSDIQIGADCLIGEYVTIRDQNHGIEFSDVLFSKQQMVAAPILIGSNVWIGAKATVVAGVTIGSNSVVAANAVVTHDVPAWTVVGGVPARVLRKIAPSEADATSKAA
jgi:acetyltransferase-like isoleucine patch superfamily enzyme